MALGVSTMASHKAIVRKLPAVETLGSVSTVCSDKTGTLTKNEMTAVAFITASTRYSVTGVGYDPTLGVLVQPDGTTAVPAENLALIRGLLLSAVLPNDGGLSKSSTGDGSWGISGDPTDVAPLVLFEKSGGSYRTAQSAARKLAVVPFESEHKWQGVCVADESSPTSRVVHIKGAPERIIPMCATALSGDSLDAPASPLDKSFWEAAAAELSSKGLRVLACARWHPPADWDTSTLTVPWVTNSKPFLTMVGLIAILDPPRPECIKAIAAFHEAGIVCKMITGDHPKTALAIGVALGLAKPGGMTLTGPQVDALSDEELKKQVLECNVYARASPDNKIRIVKALQSNKQIVSMTGDGVNDAPSLKAANIGVAMGITGTDVSKEAAKIVLQDDNFGTIVEAVREGRRVWDNLQKIFLYNLPTNFSQGLVVFFSFALGFKESPLTPIQVLYVNMIISVTLGGALSFEVEEAGMMKRKPRASNEPLVGTKIIYRTIYVTALMVVAIIGIFVWGESLHWPIGRCRAAAFTLLVISSTFYGLNCRSNSEFALGASLLRPNRVFWGSFLGVSAVQAIIVHVDGINQFFSCESVDITNGVCTTMGGVEWGVIIAVSLLIFFIVELEKFICGYISAHWDFLAPLGRLFQHKEGEEHTWSFLATSASFHGVSHFRDSHRVPPDSSKGRFSSRSLSSKVLSLRAKSDISAEKQVLSVREADYAAGTVKLTC